MRCYSGSFYSTITIPEPIKPIETTKELETMAVKDTIRIYTSRFLYDVAVLAPCCNTFEYNIGQHLIRHRIGLLRNLDFDARVRALNEYDWENKWPLVFVTTRNLLAYYSKHLTFPYHISSSSLFLDAVGIATQKDSLHRNALSET